MNRRGRKRPEDGVALGCEVRDEEELMRFFRELFGGDEG